MHCGWCTTTRSDQRRWLAPSALCGLISPNSLQFFRQIEWHIWWRRGSPQGGSAMISCFNHDFNCNLKLKRCGSLSDTAGYCAHNSNGEKLCCTVASSRCSCLLDMWTQRSQLSSVRVTRVSPLKEVEAVAEMIAEEGEAPSPVSLDDPTLLTWWTRT